MLNALCLMLYALCFMLNALCGILNGAHLASTSLAQCPQKIKQRVTTPKTTRLVYSQRRK